MTQGPENPEMNVNPQEQQQPQEPQEQDRPQTPEQPPRKSAAREWIETIIVALGVALLIRYFVVQVYLVEGESMEPTLHTQERLLVNKFLYKFRSPEPGEIVVLQDPGRPSRELIKRVIAVAGETVEVRKGVVYINDKALQESYKNNVFTQYPDTPPVQVPEGTIYVMGDNRGRSFDSRMMGSVELGKVDGKAFFMFWPLGRFAEGPLDQERVYSPTASPK